MVYIPDDGDWGDALTEGRVDLDDLPGMAYYSSPDYLEEERIRKMIKRGEDPIIDENYCLRPEVLNDPDAGGKVDF